MRAVWAVCERLSRVCVRACFTLSHAWVWAMLVERSTTNSTAGVGGFCEAVVVHAEGVLCACAGEGSVEGRTRLSVPQAYKREPSSRSLCMCAD